MIALSALAVVDEGLVSREGYTFRLSDDRWRLSKDYTFPVAAITSTVECRPEFVISSCARVLCHNSFAGVCAKFFFTTARLI